MSEKKTKALTISPHTMKLGGSELESLNSPNEQMQRNLTSVYEYTMSKHTNDGVMFI